MNVCFLLGSGISRPASLPSVDEITRKVLSPKDFFHWSDDVYRSVRQPTMLPECENREMEGVEQLLRWLKGHAELRYASQPGRQVNYEDLAYLAAQIRDDHYDNFENPALGPLICAAVNSLPGMCSAGKLGGVAEQAVNFIADVVAGMLAVQPTTLEHFQVFRQAVADDRFSHSQINLFTLNHDCLLERFLRSEGIEVVDGFDNVNGLGIRRWNPAVFDCESSDRSKSTVRLFKLHGSTNWRRLRPEEPDSSGHTPNPRREEYVGYSL